MSEKMVRLFVALPLPEPLLTYLDAVTKELARQLPPKAVRWVKPTRMHLTMRFLGNTAVSQLSPLQDAIEQAVASHASFRLRFQQLGTFPNQNRPRVIWVGLTGDVTSLSQLRHTIDQSLIPLGWEAERKPFSPHITLGRVKNSDALKNKRWGGRVEPLEFEATAVHLIKSDLKPEGPVYTTIESFALAREG